MVTFVGKLPATDQTSSTNLSNAWNSDQAFPGEDDDDEDDTGDEEEPEEDLGGQDEAQEAASKLRKKAGLPELVLDVKPSSQAQKMLNLNWNRINWFSILCSVFLIHLFFLKHVLFLL